MSHVANFATGFKIFACLCGFLTWVFAAALIAALEKYYHFDPHYATANALLVAGITLWIYLLVVLFCTFRMPGSPVISVIADTVMLGSFLVFFLGATGAQTEDAWKFQGCTLVHCTLAKALVGVAWITTVVLFGILTFEVAYTLKWHGGALSAWKTPFNVLDYAANGRAASVISHGSDSLSTAEVDGKPVSRVTV